MKKLLLVAALLFASFGAFADEFDDIVAGVKKDCTAQGWQVRSDKAKRIIFFEIKVPAASEGVTQAQFDEMKPMLVKSFKGGAKAEGAAALKKLNITLQFNFVTTDGKVFRTVISPADL